MAAANHIDGGPVFGVDLYSAEAEDAFSPGQLNNLRTYQRLEDAAVGLATLYLQQEHGDAVTLVEVRMLREPVPAFDQRHDRPRNRPSNGPASAGARRWSSMRMCRGPGRDRVHSDPQLAAGSA